MHRRSEVGNTRDDLDVLPKIMAAAMPACIQTTMVSTYHQVEGRGVGFAS